MKKIIALALIAFFMAAGVAYAGPSLAYSGDVMGQGKYVGDPHRIFRLVHVCPAENDSDGIAAGSVVVWSDLLDDGISVETTTTSNDNRVAGILINTVISDDSTGSIRTATEDAGGASWGWLQTYGKSAVDVTTFVGQGVTEDGLVGTSETAGRIQAFDHQFFEGIGVDPQNRGVLGFSFATVAGDTATSRIFIRCD